jgi:signal transduction histidine kinase
MLGLVELLRATPLDEEQRGHVAALGEAADALLAMAEDAIALARLDADVAPPPARAPVDPRALLAGVARTLAPLAAARGLALEASADADLPPIVRTDAGSVRRVLLNLAGNAIQVTRRGGVRLRARGAPDDPCALAIDVVDTGPGLTPPQRARLFRAWARPLAEDAGGDAPGGENGVGLGLVLAEALAARLGGRIAVESAHGAGSTFTLVLPDAIDATAG